MLHPAHIVRKCQQVETDSSRFCLCSKNFAVFDRKSVQIANKEESVPLNSLLMRSM